MSAPRRVPLWRRPFPEPPDVLRRGPFAPGAIRPAGRSAALSARLGLWLGAAFGICLVTGLISHGIQHPPDWFVWPRRPVSLYRVTQGLHVATGLATVPLLLAKLWAVYPTLFRWPPVRNGADLLSRAALLVLVAGAVFQLASGVLNTARQYAVLGFGFPAAHYWTAWITTGALVIHIGAQATVVRRVLRESRSATPAPVDGAVVTRRAVVATVAAAAGVVTLATVGQTVRPLSKLSVLAPRRPGLGPQGLPVNRSAAGAGVVAAATRDDYRLVVAGPRPLRLGRDALAALPQHTAELPIACVEGWSATARWTGVRLRDLLAEAGVAPGADIRIESLQRSGAYRVSTLPAAFAQDPLTLVALRLNGETLDLDHGYPCRLIAPNRPGVLQTKWVAWIGAHG
ncbi:molybdopterin-dependent oxidoreductase [Cryptosporangium arvum]|uniref:molybdopterin-dependent oxidoreductase n=1 Tax=Cryptosporangium arvum TaxID=80871 RepID=UPI001FE05D65|nr:molybdopterin-dependent oxidoreductase [Cryptosporangium arvum]